MHCIKLLLVHAALERPLAAAIGKENPILYSKGDVKMAAEKKSDKKAKVTEIKDDVVADIAKLQKLVKDVVDKGAKNVEDVHQAIAKMPLKYLQKIEKIKEPATDVLEVQEKTIGHIYGLIHNINAKVDDIAKDILKRV